MNRNITGTIRKTDGTVWAGATVSFELEHSSFDAEAQYPVNPVRVTTDAGGQLSVALWVDENSRFPTRYICTLPDASQFRFDLSDGEISADLNELRENAVEDDSPNQSALIAFLPIIRDEARQTAEQELDELSAEVATKADQTALDATNTNLQTVAGDLADLSDVVDTKAAQSAINTTNTNLQTVAGDLADLSDVVDTKAAQSALNTTNADLETAEQGITSLWIELETKAKQVSLDAAISDLQAAISQAQNTLQDLIDQKADASHSHLLYDIAAEEYFNSIAFFNEDGDLDNTDQLTYVDGKMGIGTDAPGYKLEVKERHPDTHIHTRVAADLGNSSVQLNLITDSEDSEARLNFVYPNNTTSVQSNKNGDLILGSTDYTHAIRYDLISGYTYYCGLFTGGEASPAEFPEHGSWGFYKQIHGDLQLIFNYDGEIKILPFNSGLVHF
jgi:hypothetical protein